MSTPVNVVAILVAQPGKVEEIHCPSTGKSEPAGNLQYNLWEDKADLGRSVLEERYLDRAAAGAYYATRLQQLLF